MTTPLHGRSQSPLHAFYRTPLHALGMTEETPPELIVTILAADWNQIAGAGYWAVEDTNGDGTEFNLQKRSSGPVTGGTIETTIQLTNYFDPTKSQNDWWGYNYIGVDNQEAYRPSDVTSFTYQDDPGQFETRIFYIYTGGGPKIVDGLDSIHPQYWIAQGDEQGPGIINLFLYTNSGEWPAVEHPDWFLNQDLGVYS